MSRLRNRIRKASRYTDGELLRWHRDKRATYDGLWSMAEDSGCLEDDPFEWKLIIWPSPIDADITVELLEQWRNELVESGKLIPYECDGKRYLFIRAFHDHEKPTNPQAPDLPTPPWVSAEITEGRAKDGKKWSRCSYQVHADLLPGRGEVCTVSVQSPHCVCTSSPVLSCPVQTSPDLKLRDMSPAFASDAPQNAVEPVDNLRDDFDRLWDDYGRIGSKARAFDAYRWWRTTGKASHDELYVAASRYRDHCSSTGSFTQHLATFLAKPTKHKSALWPEWADGEPHGTNATGELGNLSDVLEVGARAFGLIGGENGSSTRGAGSDHRLNAGSSQGGALPVRGLPAQCVEVGQ